MNRIVIEIARFEKHPKNYALMYPPNEKQIWDILLEKIPKDKQYLNHIVYQEWVETKGLYVPNSDQYSGPGIPYGTLTYYAAVYVQDRGSDTVLPQLGDGVAIE